MKKVFFLLFSLFLLFNLFSSSAMADFGPKRTATIDIYYEGEKVQDEYLKVGILNCVNEGSIFFSDDDDFFKNYSFSEQAENEKLGVKIYDSNKDCFWLPARVLHDSACIDSQCGYTLSPFDSSKFKVIIHVTNLDEVFISNEIEGSSLYSFFRMDLDSDGGANIYETTPFLNRIFTIWFVKSLMITLVLEFIVAIIFISRKKWPRKLLVSVILANLISLLIVWYGLISEQFNASLLSLVASVFEKEYVYLGKILLAEFFVLVFETFFIYLFNKKVTNLKKIFILSLVMNMVSFILGGGIDLAIQLFLGF